MIDYGHFLFAAPPRTGTGWFARAAYLAGFDKEDHTQAHSPFVNGNPSFRVSLVRHPCNYLSSCYASQWGIFKFVSFVHKESFNDFVRRYLLHHSKCIGQLFNQYTADTVMRLEDMPWAFIEFIGSLMPKKPRRDSISKLEKMNVSSELPKWDPGLRRLVIEAEKEICDKYEYY